MKLIITLSQTNSWMYVGNEIETHSSGHVHLVSIYYHVVILISNFDINHCFSNFAACDLTESDFP